MEDFGFYKTIRLSNKDKVESSFSKLNNVYKDIPETKGCMENVDSNCKGWCCQIQCPQLLYSEFLLIWNYISNNWTDNQICDLIERSMMTVVSGSPTKGCVFFDNESKLCNIHKKRPLNCRIYGITPDEEFKPRYEKLKELYKSVLGAVIKPQCDLVSTCNGKEVTIEDTSKWWKKINNIERSIGLPKKMITDDIGGSYRTPHDHILFYTMPENVLNGLESIRNYEDHLEKIKAVKNIVNVIRNTFK